MGKFSKEVSDSVKQKTPKNKKSKTVLVFDDKARENYLTGFSKRKQERKRVAQEKIIQDLKEEKKRIKLKKREELNEKWEKLNMQLDFEHIVEPKVYDLDSHTVTVTDVSGVDFAASAAFKLGTNQVQQEESDSEPETKVKVRGSDDSGSDSSDGESEGDSSKKDKKTTKKKKWKKERKNLSHLMSKQNQAKVRRKRKLESKLPSHMRTNRSRPKQRKRRNAKG